MIMRRIVFPLAVFLLFIATPRAQNVFYLAQIGDGAAASIIFKSSLIFVNTSAPTMITVEFFTGAGAPMTLTLSHTDPSLGNLGTGSTFQIPLGRGGSVSVETPGTGLLQVGYARVTTESLAVGGTGVFTRIHAPTGTILYEAGVPASTTLSGFSIFLDSLGARDTGLAIVNTGAAGGSAPMGSGPDTLTVTLYDKAFTQVATTDLPLSRENGAQQPAQEASPVKIAQFIWEFFKGDPSVEAQAREMEGIVTVSGANLAAVTLRTNDDPSLSFPDEVPTLTAFPVVPGLADQGTSSGSFSLLPGGDVLVTLELSPQEPQVIGAIYRLYEGETLVEELVRAIESQGLITEAIAVPRNGTQFTVTRVEVQLLHPGSRLGKRFDLAQ